VWSHFVVLLKSDFDVQQTCLSLKERDVCVLKKRSCLALDLGETKFTNVVVLLKWDLDDKHIRMPVC
jgi:hypothetical protein